MKQVTTCHLNLRLNLNRNHVASRLHLGVFPLNHTTIGPVADFRMLSPSRSGRGIKGEGQTSSPLRVFAPPRFKKIGGSPPAKTRQNETISKFEKTRVLRRRHLRRNSGRSSHFGYPNSTLARQLTTARWLPPLWLVPSGLCLLYVPSPGRKLLQQTASGRVLSLWSHGR